MKVFSHDFLLLLYFSYILSYMLRYIKMTQLLVYQKISSQKIHFVVVASPLGVDLGMSKSGLFIPIAMDCLRLVFHTLMSESQSDIPKKLLSFLTFAQWITLNQTSFLQNQGHLRNKTWFSKDFSFCFQNSSKPIFKISKLKLVFKY